jgi:murein DD-endopeptidase MepM/ murein hydrolase activator NlpD
MSILPIAVAATIGGMFIAYSFVASASERAPEPSGDTGGTGGAGVGFSPVLGGEPRKVTPAGGWHAPRWLTPGGGTTGDIGKAKSPAEIHHYHEAVDLKSTPGEPVFAPDGGVIEAVYIPGSDGGGFCEHGLKARLDSGYTLVLCDLAPVYIGVGTRVERGQVIATAKSFVHVAFKMDGIAVDPRGLIAVA